MDAKIFCTKDGTSCTATEQFKLSALIIEPYVGAIRPFRNTGKSSRTKHAKVLFRYKPRTSRIDVPNCLMNSSLWTSHRHKQEGTNSLKDWASNNIGDEPTSFHFIGGSPSSTTISSLRLCIQETMVGDQTCTRHHLGQQLVCILAVTTCQVTFHRSVVAHHICQACVFCLLKTAQSSH